MLKVVPSATALKDARPTLIDVADRLDDAKDLAQAMIMAAQGATGCDEVEIAAITRLALKVSEDIRAAKALLAQAMEIRQ